LTVVLNASGTLHLFARSDNGQTDVDGSVVHSSDGFMSAEVGIDLDASTFWVELDGDRIDTPTVGTFEVDTCLGADVSSAAPAIVLLGPSRVPDDTGTSVWVDDVEVFFGP
jgi:hypothetical protein